jgi:prolyl oligopeptidase
MRTTTRTLWSAARLLTVACMLMGSRFAGATEPPPPAPVRPVTDTYYGTDVTDNYRYLENVDDPEVQTWMKSQARLTDTVLASLPGRQPLLKRIHELLNADLTRSSFVRRGQRYFYETFEPGAALPKLYYRDGLKGAEHLLLDPAKLGKGTKTHYALDVFMPSWDGRLVAVGISAGGSEESVIHVIDVRSGKTLSESIDRASDSVITWRADNQSFFYLRYAKLTPGMPENEKEYNGRTYLHTLGTRVTGDGDPVIFGRGVDPSTDVPEGQGTFIVLSPDATYALAVANHNMDQNPSTLFAASLTQATDSHTPWRQIAAVEDGVTQFQVRGDKLYFLTLKGAPRFSLKVTSLAQPDISHADVLVPEGPAVIDGFSLAREGIYVQERDGAGSRLLLVSYDGKQSRAVALPFEGRVDAPVTDPRESGALYSLQGWIQPARMFAYDAAADQSSDSGLIPPTHLDLSQAESKEVFAVSQDGTRIPLSIVYKKGLKLDGTHPTMMTGYGSYGLSFDPEWFPPALSLSWIERGGVVAIAHVRGGGEYGESWHLAGEKSTKLNTIFDFIACGDYLVKQRYTSPKLLAGYSASAGGITVGGALTFRPDLFAVIIDQVGMSDTLRSETTPNGPPNVSEFGSVKTEDGFHDLYAMDAYLHVRDSTAYPAVLLQTGANDPRVAPWEVTKMAARLRAATVSGRPILLRIDFDAGHGMGSTEEQYEKEIADYWSFTLWQVGDPQFQPSQ